MMQSGKRCEDKKPLRRSALLRIGKRLRPWFNRIIEKETCVPNTPVLEPTLFSWIPTLEYASGTIKQELAAILARRDNVPALRDLSPDHTRIAVDTRWKSFFLYGYGVRVEENCALAPVTSDLISRIPDLNSAFFSILEPGASIPPHFGVTKGLLTCHLGLLVPEDAEACWIDIDGQRYRWRNGRCFIFDDTYRHFVENHTSEQRVVLLIQFERPTRGFSWLVQKFFLFAIRHSSFVRDVSRNLEKWNQGRVFRDPNTTALDT
ncbi:aspartyl/asparaginyl beta-hydroxylase domain-containing protein [Gluconobacter sp. OJA]|uniref:aspartyl/asparaginyl beta-hydroxylase domain-containing protein n=1 Tax=Gluconobacter sp. OJA TaxID=3145197 RepID=UPI0031F7A3A9